MIISWKSYVIMFDDAENITSKSCQNQWNIHWGILYFSLRLFNDNAIWQELLHRSGAFDKTKTKNKKQQERNGHVI